MNLFNAFQDASLLQLGLAVLAVLIILGLIFGATRLARHKLISLNTDYFDNRWREIQKKCGNAETWPLAIIDADKLVDEALKKTRFKGKTMGERMVTAQKTLTSNDTVWFAHKLRNKLVHENYDHLKERDVKEALIGFRQALKDLGALK